MTDAKFNDLSPEGSQVIRYDQAYKITVYSFGNQTSIEFDTKLDQKLGSLKEALGLAIQNGCQWFKETWETTPDGKKKKVRNQVSLDTTQTK